VSHCIHTKKCTKVIFFILHGFSLKSVETTHMLFTIIGCAILIETHRENGLKNDKRGILNNCQPAKEDDTDR